VRAWNSEFERAVWDHVAVPSLGWDPVPFEQWFDTMSLGYTHALPGKLEKAGEVLELVTQKNKNGTRLITKFCKPRKPTKNNLAVRNKPVDFPEDFELFGEYCDDDVRVECGVYNALPRPQFRVGEHITWRTTCRMNEYGVKLDIPAVIAVQEMLDYWREKRLGDLVELTGGAVHTDGQRDKALAWLATKDCHLDGYTKDDLAEALKHDIDPDARKFILIRQELSQVSTKKYSAMLNVQWGERTHNNMVYHRATTGRNGGSGLQLHNFPRDAVSKDINVIELAIEMVMNRQYVELQLVFGNPIDVAKQLLRAMIIPDDGEIFYCADFSSVENMGTVWICQDPVGLEVFENGEDQYRAFAAKQFNIKAEDVSDVIRTESKATILGSMFGAGWKTIFATNQQKGIPMTQQQAKDNVKEFRAQYAVTSESWYELAEVVKEVVEHPGRMVEYKGLKFKVNDDYLWIRLHSGRFLAYYHPKNEWVMTPWKEKKYQPTIMGLNGKQQWVRQTMTPSKIIENIVQATCRDLLMYSQTNLHEAGFHVLLNVHDEVLSSQVPDFMEMEEFIEIMVRMPDWAYGLERAFPLKAEGYTALRYRK